MKYTWIDEFLLSKPGVTKDLQKDWNWLRYQIGGKMFAAVCMGENDEPYYITLKLEPMEGEFFRQQYEDIVPGFYMNKVHWNSVKPDGAVPDELLKDMLDKSYQLVLGGLSKKKQKEILEGAACGETAHEALSCCGTKCSECGCYGSMCKGCNESAGKVFHAPEGQACPIYECSVNQKKQKSCGGCQNLPCDIWRNTKDPSMSDEEFENNIRQRVENVRGRKAYGV
ncbi:MAG: hypothetical protein HDR21_09620 [Lachnospiraceae bacterium]|nr:hypothetical protein [Lachnospiraceae bacterium]